jgi:hypothetical protein
MNYMVAGYQGNGECRAPDKLAMRDCDKYEAGGDELGQCNHWRWGFCWAEWKDDIDKQLKT